MKILHTGDNHFREKDLDESIRCFKAIIDESRNCDLVVIAGDLFNSDFLIGNNLFKTVIGLLKEIALTTSILIIRGNHDPFNAISLLNEIEFKNKVVAITEFSEVELDGMFFYCLPYIDFQDHHQSDSIKEIFQKATSHYESYIEQIESRDAFSAIVGHFSVTDVVLQNNQSILSTEPVISYQKLIDAPVDAVFLGHIHNAHQLQWNDNKIRYSGSHYRTSFGEMVELGFWTYSTVTKEWLWHKTPAKKIVQFTLTSDEIRGFDFSQLNPDNEMIRFKVELTEAEYQSIPSQLWEKFRKYGKLEVKVHPVAKPRSTDIIQCKSLSDEVREWCGVTNISFTDNIHKVCEDIEKNAA